MPVWAPSLIEDGGPPVFVVLFTAGTGLMFMTFCGGVLLRQLPRRGRGLPARAGRLEPGGEPALLIPVSPGMRRLSLLLAVALGIGGIGGIGLALDFPEAAATEEFSSGPLALVSLAFLGGALYLCVKEWKWRRRHMTGSWQRGGGGPDLVLAPSGVRFDWWAPGAAARWDELVGVHALADSKSNPVVSLKLHPAAASAQLTGLEAVNRLHPTEIRIDPATLRCDAVVLYHTLRFYQMNPAARSELGSPAALDRIARGALL